MRKIASGRERFTALVDASVSRLRPVTLAAVTTILGMAPLLADAFFANMAVTIMGGLAFASVLTLVAVPVLYAIFFRIRREHESSRGAPATVWATTGCRVKEILCQRLPALQHQQGRRVIGRVALHFMHGSCALRSWQYYCYICTDI